MPEPPITTSAKIIEVRSPGRLYTVETKNGLQIPAHISRESKARGGDGHFEIGDQVQLEFTPYDFSKARIACGGPD
ncbi:MAG: translation initiation factor IF-1 [Verrucomicrobiales bacterium]